MTRFISKTLLIAGLLFLLCPLVRPQTPTNTTVYLYDELGRLKAVITPSGEAAIYNYDAAGNIVSITRQTNATVSIVEFTPDQGAVGTSVTIYGTGFSLTPAQNSVSFNGVAATVTAASATQLIVAVPAGASTGPITVTTPNGSAASTTSFEVLQSLSITGFSPVIGIPGAAVQVNGTGFDPVAANNQLKFNITTATAGSATSTTIDTTVPTGATSGHISVTTGAITAVSSADFFVPPSPFTAASVDFTGRIAMDETKPLSVVASNHIALVVFDGTAGQRIALQATSSTIPSSTITVMKPDGSNLLNPTSLSGNWFIEPLALPVTGTYTIVVDPNSTFTGTMNLTLHNVPADISEAITAGGPAVTINTAVGQNATLTFNATAGDRISLDLTNVTISSSSVTVRKPDGTTLLSNANVGTGALFFDATTVPVSGVYSIFIDPKIVAIGSMTLALYAPVDTTGTIVIGGPPVVVTIATPGQNAQLTFTGTAGQIIEVDWFGDISFFSRPTILKPDGTQLADDYGFSTSDDIYQLPVTGTYTILIDPAGNTVGTTTRILYEIPQPVTASIVADGPPITVAIPASGQIAKVTFSGTAGQRVSLKMNNVKIGQSYADVVVTDPQGNYINDDFAYPEWFFDGGFLDIERLLDTMTLPVTGTYTITVYPDFSSGKLDLQLFNVPADVTGTILPDGQPVSITTTVPGQDARLTFTGTAGQRLSLKVTAAIYPYSELYMLKPDGTRLFEFFTQPPATGAPPEGFRDTFTLPTAGTYTIVVNGYLAFPGTTTMSLYDVPALATGTITIGGPPVTVTAAVPGHDAEVSFNGTAGQRISLKGTGTIDSDLSIIRPNGQTLASARSIRQIGPVQAELFETIVLPTTGTYKIKADTWKTAGTYTFNLYEVPADVSDGTISIGDPPVTQTATAERQNRTLTFTGTAGQSVYLKIDNNNSWLNLVSIIKPDGVQLNRRLADNAASKLIETTTLPTTGTYTILTELFGNGDGVTLTLGQGSSDVTGTIPTDGQPVTINVPTSRQVAKYTFNVTAGQRTALQRSDVTMPAGNVTAGIDLECCSQELVHAGQPGGFSLYQWATTSSQAVTVDPSFDFTGGVTVRLFDVAPDLTGTLTINGPPVTLTTTSPGQNAKLTMDGTTGQQVTLHITNNTVGKITIEITKPSVSELPLTYCLDSGASFDLTPVVLPTSGTYRVSVNPWRANMGTVTISATSP